MKYKNCNIKGFEGLYRIYENGLIYSIRKKRFLKPYLNNKKYGYLYICLISHNKKQLRTGVHRIIAHHWINPIIGTKLEVNHKDLNKLNNHYSNLEIVNHKENIIHARNKKYWYTGRPLGYEHSDETKIKMSESRKLYLKNKD